jgi:HAD superfamily hydrolase (TIGR01509 family)
VIESVVFDLDGVLLETEELWNEVREGLARERGGRWSDRAQADMMGMSSTEWSAYMHDTVGLKESPEEISAEVVGRMLDSYEERLPLVDGAAEAVRRMAAHWPLGLASSSNRELIDRALEVSGLEPLFRATVSSEEVARGKPAPDVYLEAARRLGVDPARCGAVEDSASGIRSAHDAGMFVVAIPNRAFPPSAEALGLANAVLDSISELEPEMFGAR